MMVFLTALLYVGTEWHHSRQQYQQTVIDLCDGDKEVLSGRGNYYGGSDDYFTNNQGDRFTLFETSEIVPYSKYRFTITDSFGDGLCCSEGNGKYDIKYGDVMIVTNGGDFNSSETIE